MRLRRLRRLSLLTAGLCPLPGLRMKMYRWGGISIGAQSYVNMGVHMITHGDEASRITIGERVGIAPQVVLAAISDGNSSRVQRFVPGKQAPINIEDDVWIGACVSVLPGVTIGRMSIVGAGSVVTKDVLPGSVVVGAPAKTIRTLALDD